MSAWSVSMRTGLWLAQVCTEHILLGLVAEATGKGGRQGDRSCLAAVKLEAARAEVRSDSLTAACSASATKCADRCGTSYVQ